MSLQVLVTPVGLSGKLMDGVGKDVWKLLCTHGFLLFKSYQRGLLVPFLVFSFVESEHFLL